MPRTVIDRPVSAYVQRYSWRFEVYHPALAAVMPAVHRFCSDVLDDEEPRWLTILGPSGIGKTFALRQAFRMLSRNEHLWEVKTRTGTRLPQCAHIIPGEDLTDYRAPRDYGRYDLLYVEDIGAGANVRQGSGSVTISRVAELLQYRTGKWTLLCANLNRTEISQHLDPRIASRLKRDGSVLLDLPKEVPDFSG
jgi:hypothetical protein